MSAGLLTVSTTIINESEFPSLGTPASFSLLPTTSGYGSTQSPGPPGYATNNRPNYANLMRSGTEGLVGGNEFHIHSEDFPALPGATAAAKAHSGSVGTSGALNSPSSTTPDPTLDGHTSMLQIQQAVIDSTNGAVDGRFGFLREEGQSKHGIQTHPDGEVTNIPPGMLNDQYGMAGLITYLRAVDNPAIVALALGHDLTTLGLNLNAPEMLYTSFGGPWADSPMRPLDMDVKVPSDYLTNSTIRDKLPSIRMNKLNEDSLFYLFYNCPGEVYQVAAAAELYTREWRYHKTEMLWLTRSQYGVVKEQTAAYERGSFNVFDPVQWRKIPRDMTLEYKELEERPKLPAALNMIGGPLPAILMPANATAPTSTSTSASASSTSTITASAATPTTSAMPTSTVANVNAIAAVSPAATTPTSAAVSSAPSPAAPTPYVNGYAKTNGHGPPPAQQLALFNGR